MTDKNQITLRPSDSARWSTCEGAPFFERDLVAKGLITIQTEEEKEDYTIQGSWAHHAASFILTEGKTGRKDFEDKEMEMHVKDYVAFVRSYQEEKDFDFYCEQELTLWYQPDQTGTGDAITVKKDGSFVDFQDLKYGEGISVQAKNNTQLAIYGRCFYEEHKDFYDFTDETLFRLAIFQPRIVGEVPVRLWALRLPELIAFTDKHIAPAAKRILTLKKGEHLKLVPSEAACDKCFCECRPECEVRAAHLLGELPLNPVTITPDTVILYEGDVGDAIELDEGLDLPEPSRLSIEQLQRIDAVSAELKSYMTKCQEHMKNKMIEGAKFEGKKLVQGLKNRSWKHEAEAGKFLSRKYGVDEVYEKKLISPAVAEKLVKSDKSPRSLTRFNDLTQRLPGDVKMVHKDAKGEPYVLITGETEFENEEEDIDYSCL